MSGHASSRHAGRRARGLVGALALIGLVAAGCGSAASVAPGDVSHGYPAAAPSAASSSAANGGTAASEAGPNGPTGQDVALTDNRLIVYTGQASIQVGDLDSALAGAGSAIRGLGGYVSASQRDGTDSAATATITYRIPADRWEDGVAAIQKLASKVLSVQTSSDEVTSQVVDLGARIDNLMATERALQAIMDKAVKIPDVLAIQEQLTSVQGQIEQLTAQKLTLEKQAAMGTITVTFSLAPVEVARVSSGWDPGAEIDRAAATLVSMGQGVANAGIWLAIVGLPLLVVGLICLGIAALFVRRARRRGAAGSPPAGGPIVPTAQA